MSQPGIGLVELAKVLPEQGPCLGGQAPAIKLPGGLRLIVGFNDAADRDYGHQTYPNSNDVSQCVSRSAAKPYRVAILSTTGSVGVDVETMARIRLNATGDDAWLASHERGLVAEAGDPVAELACHWVLKEAYGKALGVGLALPLDRLAFSVLDEGVVLTGPPRWASPREWHFMLYRYADAIIGIAHTDYTSTPLTPAGKNPPKLPSVER